MEWIRLQSENWAITAQVLFRVNLGSSGVNTTYILFEE